MVTTTAPAWGEVLETRRFSKAFTIKSKPLQNVKGLQKLHGQRYGEAEWIPIAK